MLSFKEKIKMSLIKNNIKIEQNPFVLFENWYKKAKRNEISNPNAMALSTVGAFNKPRTRMVLMKEMSLIPKNFKLTIKNYEKTEDILRKLSHQINIDLPELDLTLWFMKTNKIIK